MHYVSLKVQIIAEYVGCFHFLKDMSAAMSKLETLAEELEVLSKRIQLESLSETIEELHKFKDTFAEVRKGFTLGVPYVL